MVDMVWCCGMLGYGNCDDWYGVVLWYVRLW